MGDFATAAVAAQVTLDANGVCTKAGIGLTNVGPTPIKAAKAEAFLRGKKLDAASIDQAAQLADGRVAAQLGSARSGGIQEGSGEGVHQARAHARRGKSRSR